MTDITLEGPAIAAFADTAQAEQAVAGLKQAGYRDDQIGVITRRAEDEAADAEQRSKVQEGAAAGMAVGAGFSVVCGGVLWGMSVLSGVIPGIGPVIAGGTLAVLLATATAAAGAAAARLGGALKGLGISDDEAAFYEGELRAGRTIVTVQGANSDNAQEILMQRGGVGRSSDSQ